jgi:DNA mismatch repair protein MutS
MAGMPQIVILKAQKLKKLEKDHSSEVLNECRRKDEMQMSFFNLDDPLLEEIKELNLDINTITPMEALMKLNEIKKNAHQKINLFVFKIGYQSLTLY